MLFSKSHQLGLVRRVMPEYNVMFVVTADDGDAVAAAVSEWTVTPGAVLVSIHSAQPEFITHQPMKIGKNGKVGKLKRTPKHQQPSSVTAPVMELPPGDFPDLVLAEPPTNWFTNGG